MTKIPRDVTFIIDTSGSMAGQSIEQAKASLTLALSRLTTQDRFNIIQFNNRVRSLFSDLQPVTAVTIKKAVRFADHLTADGGTEMLPALRQALKGSEDLHRLQQVILLTDGQIGNEEELFELLHHRLGTRRVFTVGIGSAPNSHLMRKTAELGRGTFTYIGNTAEVKDKMDGLFRKLERPVLSDLRFDQTGWTGIEQYPSRIADLYEGYTAGRRGQGPFAPGTHRDPRADRGEPLVVACFHETGNGAERLVSLLGKAKDFGSYG